MSYDRPIFGTQAFLGPCHELDELDRVADLTWEAGIRWLREGFPRTIAESDASQFDRFDTAMEVAKRHGFEVLGLIGPAPGPSSRYERDGELSTLPKLDLWEQYVREIVDRYGHVVSAWEIHNEPNWERFWRPEPNPVEYAEVLASTYTTIRDAGSTAPILAMSMAYCDLEFIEAVFAEGGAQYAEIISVHPYCIFGAPEPGGVREGIEAVANLMEQHGLTPRIWVTEIGWAPWPTGVFSVSNEHTAADYQVRSHALALSLPYVEAVFVHCMRDGGCPGDAGGPEFMLKWGILNEDLSPKLGHRALRTTTDELRGMLISEQLQTTPGVHAYVFSGNGRQTVVAWSENDVGRVFMDPPGDHVTVVDVSGREVRARVEREEDGRFVVRVGPSPIFVRLSE